MTFSQITRSNINTQAIQEATASEPLTISQEYAMQESWRKDADKLTFIICQPLPVPEDKNPLPHSIQPEIHDHADRMIGDVNLFLSLIPDPDADTIPPTNPPPNNPDTNPIPPPPVSVTGELEIMIAKPSLHRQGYGRASLLTFIHYIRTYQNAIVSEFLRHHHGTSNPAPITIQPPSTSSLKLSAKISASNTASLSLFSSLGFARTADADSPPNFFGEYELSLEEGALAGGEALSLSMKRMRTGGVGGWRELEYG
jgi:Acetyltransferase (GNAT) domain